MLCHPVILTSWMESSTNGWTEPRIPIELLYLVLLASSGDPASCRIASSISGLLVIADIRNVEIEQHGPITPIIALSSLSPLREWNWPYKLFTIPRLTFEATSHPPSTLTSSSWWHGRISDLLLICSTASSIAGRIFSPWSQLGLKYLGWVLSG